MYEALDLLTTNRYLAYKTHRSLRLYASVLISVLSNMTTLTPDISHLKSGEVNLGVSFGMSGREAVHCIVTDDEHTDNTGRLPSWPWLSTGVS